MQGADALAKAAAQALGASPAERATTTVYVRRKPCTIYTRHHDNLVFRSISSFIANRYRVNPLSRDKIVKGVIESLMDSTPMYIVRRDIKSFYENIGTSLLERRLVFDTAIPAAVREHLRSFFEQHCADGRGLPRGIGLSATLSELFMEPFDREVKRIPGVYRYFRFADDILIFSYLPAGSLTIELNKLVGRYGLAFNTKPKKATSVEIDQKHTSKGPALAKEFEYLGYGFRFDARYGYPERRRRAVNVVIADGKVNRIKSRILVSIKAYLRDGNFRLLHQRMSVLAGNYRIYRSFGGKDEPRRYVLAGIFYNYRYCGQYVDGMHAQPGTGDTLKALDNFYFALVKGQKLPLAKALRGKATTLQLKRLQAISFHRGFHERTFVRVKADDLQAIRGVWRNV